MRIQPSIEVAVGPEIVVRSTRLKSGTAPKLVLNTLSTLTMVRLGKTYGNIMIDLQASNDKLRVRAERVVAAVTGCEPQEVNAALASAGGSAKIATLMLLTDLSADAARSRLESTGGQLHAALAYGDVI